MSTELNDDSNTFKIDSTTFTNLLVFKPQALKVKKLDPSAKLPEKAHEGDLGYDLFALEDVTLVAGKVTKVRTGIACNFPMGFGAIIRDRSSVATKREVFVVAGVIDNGYTGEILVAFYNPGYPVYGEFTSFGSPFREPGVEMRGIVELKAGDKIAQMVLTPVINYPIEETDDLTDTSRGASGFGSTGQ